MTREREARDWARRVYAGMLEAEREALNSRIESANRRPDISREELEGLEEDIRDYLAEARRFNAQA